MKQNGGAPGTDTQQAPSVVEPQMVDEHTDPSP
jgi:hypothetical protein